MKIEGKIDVRQRLIDRIDELKRDKRELFGDEDFVYIGGRTVKGGIINENTSKFYLYVYDKLVKELQDIMLSNDLVKFS